MSVVFENTKLKPNGTRSRAILYDKSYFKEDTFTYSYERIEIAHKDYNDMGITVHMCGKEYELIEGFEDTDLGVVCLIDTEVMGIIKRSVPAWAIKRIVTLKDNPECYI